METQFNFESIRNKIKESEREALVLLSNQAQNYFSESFKTQSFDGQPWEEVKRRIPGTPEYKYPKTKGLQRRTQPILIGAGNKKRGGTLRRAVSSMAKTAEISTSGGGGISKLRMIVDLDYAKVHNEGEGHNPKRQFIGQTQQLTRMQHDKVEQIFNKVWKK